MKNQDEIKQGNAVIAKYMGMINLKVERPEFDFACDLWQTGIWTEDSHKIYITN